jgi:uncharacterized protein
MEQSLQTPRRVSGKTRAHRWTRIVHVYTSLACFVIVLFFALTGITLNHPNWAFGGSLKQTTITGTMPPSWKSGTTVNWFRVAEFLRATQNLHGAAVNETSDDQQASISFKGPGYGADTFVDMTSGTYTTTVETQGLVAVMNDLHKGRDTTSSWKWVIDLAGGFLAVISATGLALQFFLRKRRRSGLTSTALGALVVVVLGFIATR